MSENLHKETPINTDMIVLARECRGFTQGELAKKLNTSQGKLSRIEHGLGHVSEEILNKLEDVLGFPRRFFFENSEVYWPLHVCNRKKSKLPQKTYLNLVAKANVRQIHIQKLLRSVEIPNRIPDWDFDEFDRDPLKVAQALRHFWNIPRGPIKNVTKILEDAGIFVIHSDFYSSSIDGFTMFFKGISPIVFINSRLPGDRLRFSLAHELGHIVMHKIPNNFMENEADEFASEFLMPSMEIKSSLSKLTFEKLASLKLYWMVSMAALLMKAGQLGKISSRTQRYWFMQLSKRGWRLREPEELAIDQEKPSLLKEVLGIHLQSLKFSVSELCELLGVFEEEFQLIYLENDKKDEGCKIKLMTLKIIIGLLLLNFAFSPSAVARETRQPWQILIDSVTYLRGLPEVAWLRAEGHNLMIGWSKPPRKFRALNLTAARNASRVLPKEEVRVISLRADQTGWHPGSEQPVICHTTAHHNEILETNC